MSIMPVGLTGAQKIKWLRTEKGYTQNKLAKDAGVLVNKEYGISTQTISNMETGKVLKPKEYHLAAILDVLEVRYGQRRSVYEAFGYFKPTPLPSKAEIEWASEEFDKHLQQLEMPAYLLDCATNLHTWNVYLPKIIGVSPSVLETFRHKPIGATFNDPIVNLLGRMKNADEFSIMLLRSLKQLIWPYRESEWAKEVINRYRALGDWEKIRAEAEFPVRPLVTISFATNENIDVQFRIMQEVYIQDDRFRAIYVLPSDEITVAQMRKWKDELA